MTAARSTLSVLVLARNEEARIASCLERVQWADDIVVVDDMSTDRTAELARRSGARVVRRAFDDFSSQGNFGLDHIQGDWVLALDADEWVTPALRDEILRMLQQPTVCRGFTYKRLNFFLGHRMRYGGWYHDILRLFRRDGTRFAGRVHHTPQVQGAVGRLSGEVEHRPFRSLEQFISRQNRYSSDQAREWYEEQGPGLVPRVREHLIWKPWKLFWKFLVKKQGFREGMHGVVFAGLFAWVHFLEWAKYFERVEGFASGAPRPSKALQEAGGGPDHHAVL
ncbi:MAG TPA: glycosyltransferase family 2 protein [bacterium]